MKVAINDPFEANWLALFKQWIQPSFYNILQNASYPTLEVISDASRKFALNEQQIYERQGYLKEGKNGPIALGIKTLYAGSPVSGLCLRTSQ